MGLGPVGAEHRDPWAISTLGLGARMEARESVRRLEQGEALLNYERARRPDEPDEPLEICR